jgi:hypothetical protein
MRAPVPEQVSRQRPGIFAERDPARKRKLEELKMHILAALPETQVRSYAPEWDFARNRPIGLDVWGREVADALWVQLSAEHGRFKEELAATDQQPELEDFIAHSGKDFRGRAELLGELEEFATGMNSGAAWGWMFVAKPGAGKSALFARTIDRLQSRPAGPLVLAYAAGADSQAASVPSMLRYWIARISAALGSETQIPQDAAPNDLEVLFSNLLARVATTRRGLCHGNGSASRVGG